MNASKSLLLIVACSLSIDMVGCSNDDNHPYQQPQQYNQAPQQPTQVVVNGGGNDNSNALLAGVAGAAVGYMAGNHMGSQSALNKQAPTHTVINRTVVVHQAAPTVTPPVAAVPTPAIKPVVPTPVAAAPKPTLTAAYTKPSFASSYTSTPTPRPTSYSAPSFKSSSSRW